MFSVQKKKKKFLKHNLVKIIITDVVRINNQILTLSQSPIVHKFKLIIIIRCLSQK
jgi:hypothetical protein